MTTVQSIVSDAQVEKVHAFANFGDTTKREVVNIGVVQAALGFSMGHTMQQIITEHGLVKQSSGVRPKLTAKGIKYLHALMGNRVSEIISYIAEAQ
jgi:hypothetical protein